MSIPPHRDSAADTRIRPFSDLTASRPTVGSVTEPPARPQSLRPVLRGMLLDFGPPLGAYYGLRAAGGVSEYIALLSATVLAGIKVAYDAIKARRLDPFAGYLMLNFGLSLAVGLATSNARMLMVGDTLVGGIGALIFLGSCIIGKPPLTQVVAERVQPPPTSARASRGARAYRHRVHVLLSAIWGSRPATGHVPQSGHHLLAVRRRREGCEHGGIPRTDRPADPGDRGGGQGRQIAVGTKDRFTELSPSGSTLED